MFECGFLCLFVWVALVVCCSLLVCFSFCFFVCLCIHACVGGRLVVGVCCYLLFVLFVLDSWRNWYVVIVQLMLSAWHDVYLVSHRPTTINKQPKQTFICV